MSDMAQWFDAYGLCRECSKPATGVLRSYIGNSSLGLYCKTHAEARIKKAHRKGAFEPDAALTKANQEGSSK